jgi:hypothetical protein
MTDKVFSDCKSWEEDVDGDAHDDGTPYCIVNHNVRISDGHLSELMDMAGIPAGRMMESTLDRLKRANDEDLERTYREREMEQLANDGQL